MNYDVAIIGAGPGGYVAAIRAAQRGLKTVLFEKSEVGGTCLNKGCIPTKSFVATAEKKLHFKNLSELGLVGTEGLDPSVDITKVVGRKRKIVDGLRGGIKQLLKSNKIDYVNSAAKFKSKVLLEAGGVEYNVKNVIIATGSDWKPLPNLKTDGAFIVTSDELLELSVVPKKLVVVGGGVIGCEFASIMNAFGSEVTIVEFCDQILPLEDAFVARMLTLSFKKRGIKVLTKTTVQSAVAGKVTLSNNEVLDADQLLVSVGRKPFIDGLSLESAGVEVNKGYVTVDAFMRTNVENIYSIGDCATPSSFMKPALAHVASFEAGVAVANIAGGSVKMDYNVVPRPIFTSPEVACVGQTEKGLKEQNIEYKTGKFPYAALSKAACDGAIEGFLQVYIGTDGAVLGAFGMGSNSTDLCAEIALAMRNGLKAQDIEKTIHAHPTYSEIVAEAFEDALGHPVHKASRA